MFFGLTKIRQLAARKGFSVEGPVTARDGTDRILLVDRKGKRVEAPDKVGFSLAQADRYLSTFPDAPAPPSGFGKRGLPPGPARR